MQAEELTSRLSGDDVVELVKENRNDIINKLLRDEHLKTFLFDHYQMQNVSVIKLEFIKRCLKELVSSPVDLSYYASLILDVRRMGSIASRADDPLFLEDIKNAIRSYTVS